MARSLFQMGLRGDPFLGTSSMATLVGTPVMMSLSYEQIKAQGWRPLRDLRMPPGYVTMYPFVVKLTDGTGEFLIYADGVAQWTGYGSGFVSGPFRIK